MTPAKRILLALALLAGCAQPSELPELYAVPSADLVTDAGRPLNLDELRGHVAVYDFIFTRCGATCPMMTRRMQQITTEFPAEAPIRFVSVSVDPTYDTPAVLAAYAASHRKDPRWIFLTGERDEVLGVSTGGFKLAAGIPQEGIEPILHSTKFVLVDARGIIRAYYEAGDRNEMAQLVADARQLIEELD